MDRLCFHVNSLIGMMYRGKYVLFYPVTLNKLTAPSTNYLPYAFVFGICHVHFDSKQFWHPATASGFLTRFWNKTSHGRTLSKKNPPAIKTNQNYIKVEIPRLGITRLLGIDLGPPSWKQFQSQDRSQSRPWCFNGLDSPQMRHLVTGSCWMETKLFFLDVFGSWLNEKQDEFQTSSGPSSCWVYGKKTNN